MSKAMKRSTAFVALILSVCLLLSFTMSAADLHSHYCSDECCDECFFNRIKSSGEVLGRIFTSETTLAMLIFDCLILLLCKQYLPTLTPIDLKVKISS